MRKLILIVLVFFVSVNNYAQITLAKDSVYTSIKSIKEANPDSVFIVSLGWGWENENIRKIPRYIFKLKNLKSLCIVYSNGVSKIPYAITRLKNLEKLHFGRCNIKKIPNYISKIDNLKRIEFAYCKISGIPETIGELQYLEKISIVANKRKKFKPIPMNVFKLKNINELYIEGGYYGNCYFKKDSIIEYKKRLPKKCIKEFGCTID